MNKTLQLRKEIKAKKPNFLKQDAHRVKKLKSNWRLPRGMHSKMRLKLRSYRKLPSPGYRSPTEVRGLTKEGHTHIVVKNLKDLESVETPFFIGSNVGQKKRLELIKKAQSKKIEILNIKNPEEYVKKIEEHIKNKKEVTKKRLEKKQKKEKAKKEAEEKSKKDKTKENKSKENKSKEKSPEEKSKEIQKIQEKEKKKVLEKKE